MPWVSGEMELSLKMEMLLGVEEEFTFGEMTAWSKVIFCELGKVSASALAWLEEKRPDRKEKTPALA